MTSDRTAGSLPPYLAGTLLLRGLKRITLTIALVAAQVTVLVWVQSLVGYPTNAAVAPVVLAVAWLWGRYPGAIYGVVTVFANAGLTSAAGLPAREVMPLALEATVVAVVAFTVGHVGMALERALGARARATQAYDELEAVARDRMLKITDQVPIGLYRTTPAGEIIGGNDAMVKILGFPDRDSMLATNVWDHYVNAADRSSRLITPETPDDDWSEFQLRRDDGSVIWVRDWAVAVVEAGETVYFDGVLEDITEARAADERFRAAFEDSPYGMTISTTDGYLIRGNQAIAELLGIPLEKLKNMHFSQFTFEDEMDITPAALAKAESGEIVRYEKRLKRPDGTFFWALVSLAPIRGADDPKLFISHIVDITERHQVREGLENLVRSKDELIASVSHELRTPLTVVHGLAQELDASWMSFTVPEQKEFIAMISQQSAEVVHIVEDLLVAARADIGKLPIHPESVDLRSEVDAAIASVPDLDSHLAQIGSDVPPVAYADPSRVRQIVRNLLANASRYGGPTVEVRYGANDSKAWLEVRDDGAGVAPSEAALIFEPYERAHNAAGQPMSVGLGLTVSRKLADLMGGSLDYSYEHGWSTFCLELPAPGAVHTGRS